MLELVLQFLEKGTIINRMHQKKRNLLILIIIFSLFSFLSAESEEDKSEPSIPIESEVNYSDIFSDLRRFEIISFGSMPFVTLDTTLAYSVYKFFANNFDTSSFNIFSSKNYSQSEINGILITSASISVGIAITDLIINIVKRKNEKNKYKDLIEIYPEERKYPMPKTSSIENFEKKGVE